MKMEPESNRQLRAARLVDITMQPRTILAYPLLESEIETLRGTSFTMSLHLALLGICLGVFVTTFFALRTAQSLSGSELAIYAGVCMATGLGSLVFGIRSFMAWRQSERAYRRVLNRNPLS
jgi:hypothetical protein